MFVQYAACRLFGLDRLATQSDQCQKRKDLFFMIGPGKEETVLTVYTLDLAGVVGFDPRLEDIGATPSQTLEFSIRPWCGVRRG